MVWNNVKEILSFVGDFIDQKLQTKTGRLTLLIIGGLIVGGSAVHSYNMAISKAEAETRLNVQETLKDTLQRELNTHIANADKDCNEKIKEGALLHQQLQDIYNNKTKENESYIKAQEQLISQKEKVISKQADNIKKLDKLAN